MKKRLIIFSLLLIQCLLMQAQSWCGDSFVTVGSTWYTGSNSYLQPAGKIAGANLGTLSSGFTLGGELNVYPWTSNTEALCYRIDNGNYTTISLPQTGTNGNNSKHYGSSAVNLDGLAAGSHTLELYFKAGNAYDSNNSNNYKATFNIAESATNEVRTLVKTSIDFPTSYQPLDLIFDLTQGNGAMKDFNPDSTLFVHTGVITDKSSSNSDWKNASTWLDNNAKYQLTSLGDYKWKLTIPTSLRSFYQVAATDSIKYLAFILRDRKGSAVAKDVEDKDILVKVYSPGLQVKLKSLPFQNLLKKDSVLKIDAVASANATVKVYLDNSLLQSATNTTELKTNNTFSLPGQYWLIGEAADGTNTVRDSVWVVVKKDVETLTMPTNVRAGINVQGDSTVTLVLYAPYKSNVYVIGDFNDWKLSNNYQLYKDGDNWWITLKKLTPGKEYAYQYVVDGDLKIADPYTDKILDPWDDSSIPSSVYPNLKPYPVGKTTGIVSVLETGQTPYQWTAPSFTHLERNKLVIYELHVRDFVAEHSFDAVKGKLDYLQTLGINAIELMPINEFEGNNSWGYNPSFYFAVDKYYGTKDAFKSFVDECHKRSISVIMDLVLNHSFGQSPFARLYWDTANKRPASNNPWYNVTAPNTSYSWGSDFNHESPQTQALVDSINSYWMSEYKVDGFRYDFTKGFTNTVGDGYAYDASRIAILDRMSSQIWKRNSKAYVILEHLTDNSEEKELAYKGMMLWGNMNNSYCEALSGWTGNSDMSWAVYSNRGWIFQNLVAYMESHDEERTMFKALNYGNVYGSYSAKDLTTALERAKALAAFYILLPGPKMIWEFGELGYDYSINSDGVTLSSDNRTAPKPIRWDYYDDPRRKALYDVYSTLISYKNQYPVFTGTDVTYSIGGTDTKSVVWRSADMNAFVVGNFGVTSNNVTANLPKTGLWYDVFNDEYNTFSSTTYSQTLEPGEFRLYVDNKQTTSVNGNSNVKNPLLIVKNEIINTNTLPLHIGIYDLSGRNVCNSTIDKSMNIDFLNKGVYTLKVLNSESSFTTKIIRK